MDYIEKGKLWDEVQHMPFYDNRDGDAIEDLILSIPCVRIAIENPPAERERAGWISVEDRLPEFYDRVLVSVESVARPSWIATAYRTRLVSGDWYWRLFGYPSSIGEVTHWMQLPAPPDLRQMEKGVLK